MGGQASHGRMAGQRSIDSPSPAKHTFLSKNGTSRRPAGPATAETGAAAGSSRPPSSRQQGSSPTQPGHLQGHVIQQQQQQKLSMGRADPQPTAASPQSPSGAFAAPPGPLGIAAEAPQQLQPAAAEVTHYPTFVPRNPGVRDGVWRPQDEAVVEQAKQDAAAVATGKANQITRALGTEREIERGRERGAGRDGILR